MSTQYSNEIPFSANHTQQAFKFLELPPELLALLESDTPPTLTILPSPTPPHHAHLTVLTTSSSTSLTPSPGKTSTYLLRQKNTSNPLILLAPSSTPFPSPNDPSPSSSSSPSSPSSIPLPSITCISTISETIELITHTPEISDPDIPQDEDGQKPLINLDSKSKPESNKPKLNKWHEKFAKTRNR
ncbi:hypothetical protein SBOR_10082 [Sclerotinia borealis F-4128]|uniref:Uncharacterized protein n=1 Tax=Sclerotinia borealis (strain F-4128) TaxID=1432307 RepID=W9C3M2_SCLBF|nr:hypothetical protein SBOR_10082 [Sclerotinia borealis F-4128]